jgi:hypothetical protein
MINRTFIVKTPIEPATYVDICVQATMGTRTAPVANPALFPPGSSITPPPVGWAAACGDGAYYEVRGRPLRCEHLAGVGVAGGFTQRANLGFILSLVPYGNPTILANWAVADGVQLSASLLATVGGDNGGAGAIATTVLADPVYGVAQPVIRVFSPVFGGEGAANKLYVVSFSVAERKDDDYSNLGGP